MKKIYFLFTLLLSMFAMESFADVIQAYIPKATMNAQTKDGPTSAAAYVALTKSGLSEKENRVTYTASYQTTEDATVKFYLSAVAVNGYSVTWSGENITFSTENGVDVATVEVTSDKNDLTYTAKATYSKITYTITYDLDGGTVSGTNPTTYNIETDDITLINPTKAGYEFTGWTWEGQTTPVKDVTIEKGSTGNRAYKANYEYIYSPVTLNTAGLATYSAAEDFVISTENVKAYSAIVDWTAQTITLSEVEGAVPAGQGVLLYGTAGTQVSFAAPTTEIVATLTGNGLKATTNAAGELVQMPTSGDVWALGTGSEFMKFDGQSFVDNRAYLHNDTQAPAKSLRMIFADKSATAINAVSADKTNITVKCIENGRIVIKKNGAKYNVSGQMMK